MGCLLHQLLYPECRAEDAPVQCPEFTVGKKPYSSGRDSKENAALRHMTNFHVAQSSTSFLHRTWQAGEARGGKQKMRRVTSSTGTSSTF